MSLKTMTAQEREVVWQRESELILKSNKFKIEDPPVLANKHTLLVNLF